MDIYYIILIIVSIIILAVLVSKLSIKETSLTNKHVVITGGSSGIGKSLAVLAVQKGAHVTIIARNAERLREAHNELKTFSTGNQVITKVSSDVSRFDLMKNTFDDLEELVGPIFMLVNCAGFAKCGVVEDLSVEDVQSLIDVNFLGTLYPIQAVIPKFKQRREGIIVLTASQAALVGIYGLSVYSSCKFALRGLAESIKMELRPFNISVTMALPADTDTPGFETENKSKPLETKLIAGSGGLYKPEDVAANILKDALRGKFFSTIGFESYLLTTLCTGMSPFHTLGELLVQFFLLGTFRIIAVIILFTFNNTVRKCHNLKESKKSA